MFTHQIARIPALCELEGMREPNFFGESGLDRMSERRADESWLADLRNAPEALYVPVWRTRSFVDRQNAETPVPVHLDAATISELAEDGAEFIFLGYREGVPYFSVDLSHLDEPEAHPHLANRGEFADIRDVSLFMPRQDGAMLAYARAIAHWHRTHRFCGRCGSPTEAQNAGHVRRCVNPDCGAEHFPRTDPAVIMLIHRGDRVILGRKKGWPEGRYSILAGFVEPGETLEGAVIREVMEEVGVPVSNVRYHSSQPWPFPANLMLGYFAEAQSETLNVCDDELEHARWFTRDELMEEALEYRRQPTAVSIARRMLSEWVTGEEP